MTTNVCVPYWHLTFLLPWNFSIDIRRQIRENTVTSIVTFLGRCKEFPTRQIEEKTFLIKYSQKEVKNLWYLYCEVFTGNEMLPHRLPPWNILSAFSVKVRVYKELVPSLCKEDPWLILSILHEFLHCCWRHSVLYVKHPLSICRVSENVFCHFCIYFSALWIVSFASWNFCTHIT